MDCTTYLSQPQLPAHKSPGNQAGEHLASLHRSINAIKLQNFACRVWLEETTDIEILVGFLLLLLRGFQTRRHKFSVEKLQEESTSTDQEPNLVKEIEKECGEDAGKIVRKNTDDKSQESKEKRA